MKKFNIAIILIQVFGIIFLLNGFFQIKIFSVFEKYNCAHEYLSYQRQKSECWLELYAGKENVFDFLSSVFFWKYYGLLIGVLLIALINWKNKISILNTFLSTLFTCLFFFFLFEPLLSISFNDFGLLFSNNSKTRYLIGGTTFSCIGFILLYLSYNLNLFNFRKTFEI